MTTWRDKLPVDEQIYYIKLEMKSLTRTIDFHKQKIRDASYHIKNRRLDMKRLENKLADLAKESTK